MKILFNGRWLDLTESTIAEHVFLFDILTELERIGHAADKYMVITGFEDAHNFAAQADERTIVFIFDEHQKSYSDVIRRSKAVFQAYIGDSQLEAPNHHTFPLGYAKYYRPAETKPINERPISVFFSGNLHRGRVDFHQWLSGWWLPFPLRHRIHRWLGTTYDWRFRDAFIRFTGGFAAGLAPEQYSLLIQSSKIVLCPSGSSSVESYRLYEALRSGCAVITTAHPHRDWFRDVPAIVVHKWRDAEQIIEVLLRSPDRLAELSEAGLNWFRNHASAPAVAKRIKELSGEPNPIP